jgi:hypothetical protein
MGATCGILTRERSKGGGGPLPYGIVLIVEEPAARDLVIDAHQLAQGRDPIMIVGAAAPPHVTLLHAHCDIEGAVLWWNRVRDRLHNVPMEPIGLLSAIVEPGDYYVPGGGVYYGLEVFRTQALAEAHEVVCGAAAALSLRGIGRTGEFFRPHVTLGVLDSSTSDLPVLDANRYVGGLRGVPALGQLGPYGTFPKIIERLAD